MSQFYMFSKIIGSGLNFFYFFLPIMSVFGGNLGGYIFVKALSFKFLTFFT